MNIYFLQKRLDKKVVYWDVNGRPVDKISFAAHVNVSLPLRHPETFPSIIDWVKRLRDKGFTGIIQPIIVFDNFECRAEEGAIYTALEAYISVMKTIGESDAKDCFDFRTPEENVRETVQEAYLKKDDENIPW